MNPTGTSALENIVESSTPIYSSSPNNNSEEENPYIDVFPARQIQLDLHDDDDSDNDDEVSDVTVYDDVIDDIKIDCEHYQQLPSSSIKQYYYEKCEKKREPSFTTIEGKNDCMTGYDAAKERYEDVLRCDYHRKRSRSFPEYQRSSNHGDNDINENNKEEELSTKVQSSLTDKEIYEGGEGLPPKKNKLRPLPIRLRRRKMSLKLKFRKRSESSTELSQSSSAVIEKKKKLSFPDLLRWNFQITTNMSPNDATEIRRFRARTNPY